MHESSAYLSRFFTYEAKCSLKDILASITIPKYLMAGCKVILTFFMLNAATSTSLPTSSEHGLSRRLC